TATSSGRWPPWPSRSASGFASCPPPDESLSPRVLFGELRRGLTFAAVLGLIDSLLFRDRMISDEPCESPPAMEPVVIARGGWGRSGRARDAANRPPGGLVRAAIVLVLSAIILEAGRWEAGAQAPAPTNPTPPPKSPVTRELRTDPHGLVAKSGP